MELKKYNLNKKIQSIAKKFITVKLKILHNFPILPISKKK